MSSHRRKIKHFCIILGGIAENDSADVRQMLPGMLMRPEKCEAKAKAEATYHEAEAELCDTEAEARDAVLIINY